MKDLNSVLKEQLARPEFARQYDRTAPFYRLAEQLILLRKKRDLTQGELAQKAETTQAVVSRLENASVRASLETVIKLADALNAVVELKIIPREEYHREFEQGQPEETVSKDASLSAENPGTVYFGSSKKAVATNIVWYQPNPDSLTTRKGKPQQKRQPEVA